MLRVAANALRMVPAGARRPVEIEPPPRPSGRRKDLTHDHLGQLSANRQRSSFSGWGR